MKIYILNTVEIGLDITDFLKKELNISGIIGLSKREKTDAISGYVYCGDYAEKNNIEFIEVNSYTLNNEEDKAKILGLDIDILIVAGWQRLIPQWLINHCKICAIGSHGSAYGITGGRGRSPQNWALILGKKEFFISIFKIDSGIDSGQIIDTEKYVLNEFDDIKTSYYKVCCLMSNMVIKNIRNNNILSQNFTEQDGEANYLPQRTPEDGQIDWSKNNFEIYNFIRALTKPYPGAHSLYNGEKIIIWKARIFDLNIHNEKSYANGEIIKLFNNGDFLIKTGEGLLLIEEYDTNAALKEGFILESADFKRQINNIIERHYKKYPDLKVSGDLIKLSGNEVNQYS